MLTTLPEELTATDDGMLVPEKVVRSRIQRGVEEWLVQWKGLHEEKATWEEKESAQRQFPESYLEDKVIFQREGGRGLLI